MQNQISPSNSGIALNSGVNAGLPGSDVSSFSASSSEDKSAEVGMVQNPWSESFRIHSCKQQPKFSTDYNVERELPVVEEIIFWTISLIAKWSEV